MIERGTFQKRVHAVLVLGLVVFTIFGIRLIDVQAVQAKGFAERASNEMWSASTLLAPRGRILDVNGVELARSVAAVNIVVDQTMITDPQKTASVTAPIFKMSQATVASLLTGKKRYQIIVKQAPPAMWSSLNSTLDAYNKSVMKERGGISKRLVGFFSERAYVRDYPTGRLAASLVGIINDAGVGAAGLESSMDATLAGQNGKYVYANGAGAIIPGSQEIITEAVAGKGIQLTIDRDIQWVAQNAISAAVKKSNAASGTVIVMDPKSGEILAQASAPNFDPANKKSITNASLRNPAVQDVYEPGSTGKIITIASAIEEGNTTPQNVWTIPYAYKVSGVTYHDHERHATQRLTTAGVLAVSSNTGTIQIGATLSNEKLYSYLRKFGLGESTGSHLPGESAGLLPHVDTWSRSSAPTFAFGQGYSLTALQATSIFATIANDGVRVTPNVIAGFIDSSGKYTKSKPQSTTRVVSASTAQQMRLMMESVVSEQGTAPAAAIPGYRVAGKTGTAQRADSTCHCYRGYTASFIGFAPADAPKYVVSVVIQNPQGMHWGGVLGGPVFKEVMSFVLQSKHVPPTAARTNSYALTEASLKKTTTKVVKKQ
jgi:cell division protein FtsI (penicillin-binding protein 3)